MQNETEKKEGIETSQMIIRQVPDALRREFKALCAREGKSMQEKIIDLMRLYVAQKHTS